MPNYKYYAVDRRGKSFRGLLNAVNPIDLEDRLKSLGYQLIDFKLEAKRGSLVGFTGIKEKDLISFCVHMEELDKAGVPLIDSLTDLRDSIDNMRMRELMSELTESVKGGELLSAALAKRPDIFDEVFIGLISSGEETGNIGDAFGHLSRHIKWNVEFKRKIKKALTYPVVLLFVMFGVVMMMMNFVVPQLAEFIKNQGLELPWYTNNLIATSDFFVANWAYILFAIPTAITSLILFYNYSEPFRLLVDSIILRIPLIGQVVLKTNVARFVRFFSITFNSGIGVLESLNSARKVVPNRVLKNSISQITKNISEGMKLTDAIRQTGRFPSLVLRMFKVGEESGNMESALSNINFFYEREIDDTVSTIVAAIQPTLMIVLGGILFWIIAAIFGPVYSSFGQMKF
jgi:type IV pilus assembly protein PilC